MAANHRLSAPASDVAAQGETGRDVSPAPSSASFPAAPSRSGASAQDEAEAEHLGMDVARWLEGSAVVVYVRAHQHRCPDCGGDWTCLALECGPFGAPDNWTGVPSCGWATCPDCEGPRWNGADLPQEEPLRMTYAEAVEIADKLVRTVPRETSGERFRHVDSLARLLVDLSAATNPEPGEDFVQMAPWSVAL